MNIIKLSPQKGLKYIRECIVCNSVSNAVKYKLFSLINHILYVLF